MREIIMNHSGSVDVKNINFDIGDSDDDYIDGNGMEMYAYIVIYHSGIVDENILNYDYRNNDGVCNFDNGYVIS